jgi:hypothetical protein
MELMKVKKSLYRTGQVLENSSRWRLPDFKTVFT